MDTRRKFSITVVTICYNAVDKIEKTILSVLSQTYTNLEYIIIDGGSTDGTQEIISKYENQIAYHISEKDNGIYDAMNKGIRAANGEWIIFMNADDVFADDKVLENIFSNDIPEHVDMIYSDYLEEDDKGQIVRKDVDVEKGIFMHQSIIYKKALHHQYGYYLVTRPIIISDFLFLASVPISAKMRTSVTISKIAAGGISQQGLWAGFQMYCGQHIFFREPILVTVKKILKLYFHGVVLAPIKAFIRR